MAPKSEVQILHEFQLKICRKEFDVCPHWNSGCSFQKACKKLSNFRAKVRREEKEEIEKEKQKRQKEILTEPQIPLKIVQEKLQSTQRMIDVMQLNKTKLRKVDHVILFEMENAIRDIKSLLSFK